MKKLIFVILLIITWHKVVLAQDRDCARFKNGKFELVDSLNGKIIITRKGNVQTEYMVGKKLKLALKVTWLDDCTYVLVLKEVLENPNKLRVQPNLELHVSITETNENGYVQHTSGITLDKEYVYEMRSIE